ncbi:MAG: protocatechuate 3,4-dioxygenase [Burkholderiaceae bacterium]
MNRSLEPLPRRRALRWVAALAAPAFVPDLRAQERLRPTPAQTEGPFYPLEYPADSDADLLVQGAVRYTQGIATQLSGGVRDTAGRPLRDAVVEIWQCDQQGHYRHPGDGGRADPAFQGYGRAVADASGAYRFRTLRPVPYSGRTPHIHVKVRLGARELLTTQLYVDGDPGNPGDGLWRRLSAADRSALTVPFAADGAQGSVARFDIVVATG